MADDHAECITCHASCRMIAKFCPHCGAKMSSVFLAAKRKLPALARFTTRQPALPMPLPFLLEKKTPPRKSTVRTLKKHYDTAKTTARRTNQQHPGSPAATPSITEPPLPSEMLTVATHNCPVEPVRAVVIPAHTRSEQSNGPSNFALDVETRLQAWIARLQKLHAAVIV
jgi:hypothetical protein